MTIVLARELERSGVRVTHRPRRRHPAPRHGRTGEELTDNPMMSPDNPAAGAVWLASPLAEGVTGQVLKIMGGVAPDPRRLAPRHPDQLRREVDAPVARRRPRPALQGPRPGGAPVPGLREVRGHRPPVLRPTAPSRLRGCRRPRPATRTFVDVQELEPGEQRVALVDLGVADVHVAVGRELRPHLVQVVLAADEFGLDAVT